MEQALHQNLTEFGLSATRPGDLNWERFNQIHREVGKIKLYSLERKVNLALELTGMSERVSENKFRSVYRPEMLVEPLTKFCKPKVFCPRNKKALESAIRSVEKKLVAGTRQPIELADSYQRLLQDKSDHFAGLPTLGKKVDDVDALKRAEQCWVGKCPPPPVIGHRGKNTEIVRAVWMFPFEWHIVEGAFYYPLFDVIRQNPIYPVGPIYDRRYTARKYCNGQHYSTKFSLDYSGFDASLGTQMIGIAFSILSKALSLTPGERKVWERVQTYFATSPFLAPDGLVYKGRRGGVPSGSMFTQLIDSVCNAVALEYALRCEGIKDYRYMVYGDDSWTILKSREKPHVLLSRISEHVRTLGLQVNVDKTEYAVPEKAIVFCGHYDIMRGRPLQECIDRLVYPERPSEMLTTREGMCERLVAYMADADCMALNAVYLSTYYNKPIETLIGSGFETNLTDVLRQEGGSFNIRHLPGVLQVAGLVPREASSLMKIRASI